MMSFKRVLDSRWIVLAAGLFTAVLDTKGYAGDLKADLEYTNMTPGELAEQASIQCSNTLKERLRGAFGESLGKMVYVGEAERRKRVKSKSDVTDFMKWGKREIPLDDFTFVVAADCRPGIQHLDVLLVGRKGSVTFRLRGVPLVGKRLNWLADDVALRAETMLFS